MAAAGNSTKDVQVALKARGYDPGPLDGDAGSKTIAAVTAFQKTAGLVADGIAGPLTIAALTTAPSVGTAKRAEPVEPGWLTLARGELGTVEGIGSSNNPKVVRYFADAGFAGVKDDATAWCAAFVGAMLHRAGHTPSGSLAARSYEGWGVGLAQPVLGCIGTKRRGGSTWQGHVGIVVAADRTHVTLLGGNQGDKVSTASFARSEFTAFRWPADVPVPASSKLPSTAADARIGVSEA